MYTRIAVSSKLCLSLRGRNMVSIIVWNMAGEFVSPKYMTNGSNKPYLVLNAALYSSPFLILILLYPQRMSNFVNMDASFASAICSLTKGTGQWFFFVSLLTFQ